MQDAQVIRQDAKLQALQQQRNEMANVVVNVNAEWSVTKAQLETVTKALEEAQAKIVALEAELVALKAKPTNIASPDHAGQQGAAPHMNGAAGKEGAAASGGAAT